MAPGVYDGIAEDVYHADRTSLSVSGAKKLLPPSCPALFRYEQDNGQPHKAAFDFGRAAHTSVLGVGESVIVCDFPDWKTKAAREKRDEVYAQGYTPLLQHEYDQIIGMTRALRQHPIASALLDPEHGKPEQSLYRTDEATGVTLRARYDWLPDVTGGRLVIPDYKTARCAEPGVFARAAASYGYHMQAAWYVDMAEGLGLATDVSFVFVVQEKTAPYLVSVVALDDEALEIGRRKNREAIELYARCVADDHWPSWSDGIEYVSLPAWATYDLDMEVA